MPSKSAIFSKSRISLRWYPAKRALPAMLTNGRYDPFGRIPSITLNAWTVYLNNINRRGCVFSSTYYTYFHPSVFNLNIEKNIVEKYIDIPSIVYLCIWGQFTFIGNSRATFTSVITFSDRSPYRKFTPWGWSIVDKMMVPRWIHLPDPPNVAVA